MNLAEIAHELNNPLTLVLANVGFLLEPAQFEDPVEQRAVLTEILAGACRLRDLVASMRVLGTDAHGPCLISDVVGATLGVCRHAAARRGATLTEHISPGLLVLGVASDLLRLLLNLIMNAVDAGAHQVAVRVDRSGAMIEWSVTDDGPGIPVALLSRVCEPGITTKVGGGGLGLALCCKIAAEHGGELRINSEQGAGTTVFVRLPAYEAGGA